jgi:diguanylate cyclase (GGDEF)-like protein
MKTSPFISRPVLAKLQAVYNQLKNANANSTPNASQFTVALKEFLVRFGEERTASPGEILFEQGDPGEHLYWIESGSLAILQGKLTNPTLLTFRYPGHVVGEIALLENISRTASVIAIQPTRLRYLSKEKFQEILAHVPDVSLEIMRLLSSRLREVKPTEYSAGNYDHLTGALSRQALNSYLEEEISRAERYAYNFALVFIDLDEFKEINDRYGHVRGDHALVEFVRRMVLELRTTDLFFRYDGAEFILILQGVNHERGPALVQRLMDLICLTPLPGDPPLFLSFSAGIAYYPEDGQASEGLFKVAGQRLFHAKKSGRNTVDDSQVIEGEVIRNE